MIRLTIILHMIWDQKYNITDKIYLKRQTENICKNYISQWPSTETFWTFGMFRKVSQATVFRVNGNLYSPLRTPDLELNLTTYSRPPRHRLIRINIWTWINPIGVTLWAIHVVRESWHPLEYRPPITIRPSEPLIWHFSSGRKRCKKSPSMQKNSYRSFHVIMQCSDGIGAFCGRNDSA